MPYFSCEDEVRKILDELPSENPCIDYKQIPYTDEKKFELLIDLVALLNCEEAVGYDRYIVIGVGEEDHHYLRIGLRSTMPPMPDDNELQAIVNLIRPRPTINCGTVTYSTETYGYIHISSTNTNRTYEVSKTYPEITHKVHEGQAFIRIGTTKRVMTQMDRARIESQVDNKYIYVSPLAEKPPLNQKKTSLSQDLVAALVGVWNSQYEGDREVIKQLSGLQYEDWEIDFQRRLAEGDERITFSQGVWSFQGHVETLIGNAKAYFDNHLSDFFNLLNSVLNAYDAKFDLSSDIRFIKASNTPNGKYSSGLREAFILSFVNIANKDKEFTSCSRHFIANEVFKTITKLISEGTWQVFATLNWQLVSISQTNPDAFCNSLQSLLKKPNNAITKLLAEKEHGIISTGYYHGLVAALQTLAWCERYFPTASNILFSLTMINEEIKGSFIAIFLPWYPQTNASANTRIGVIKQLVTENGTSCWDVVYKLMPRQSLSSMDIEAPKFIEGSYERREVLLDEYWSVSEQYLEQLIVIAHSDFGHIVQLIDLLDDVNSSMFQKILDLISDISSHLENDDERFPIWDKLVSFTKRHRRFADANWSLPENLLEKIDALAKLVAPKDMDKLDSRLFKKEQYDLIGSYEDYHLGEIELKEQQTVSITRIYREHQLSGVFEFARNIESPQIIGQILSELILRPEDENCILDQLLVENENLQLLAKNYCNTKFRLQSMPWLTSLNISSLPAKRRLLILSSIYICKPVLDIVVHLPDIEQKEFWLIASHWAEEDAHIRQTVEGLIGAERYEYALKILTHMINEEKIDSTDIAYFVLEANLRINENRSQMWSYYVNQIFEWLQKRIDANDLGKLVHYEWLYYRVLSHEGRAKALEYTLASSPEDFLQVLGMVYKSNNELDTFSGEDEQGQDLSSVDEAEINTKQKLLAEHAWQVLYGWKWVPGVQLDSLFDTKAFTNWVASVKLLSAQKGLYEIAMQKIGHVLYYAPSSEDGFYILHEVAKALEKEENDEMRSGYRTEAFNARGVYNYDPSGKQEDDLAKLWIERALNAEGHGYTRFGKTLRDIAQSFLDQKDHY